MGSLRRGRPVPPETVEAECLAVVHASALAEDGRLGQIRELCAEIERREEQIARLTRERDRLQQQMYALQEEAARLNTVHTNVAREGLMELENGNGRSLRAQTAAA